MRHHNEMGKSKELQKSLNSDLARYLASICGEFQYTTNATQWLYQFPRAAVTKHHSLCGLKQQQFILSQFWRLEVYNQAVGRAMLSLKAQGEESFFSTSSFWWLQANLVIPWLVDALFNVFIHLHMAFSPVCLCTGFPLFIRTTIIGGCSCFMCYLRNT